VIRVKVFYFYFRGRQTKFRDSVRALIHRRGAAPVSPDLFAPAGTTANTRHSGSIKVDHPAFGGPSTRDQPVIRLTNFVPPVASANWSHDAPPPIDITNQIADNLDQIGFLISDFQACGFLDQDYQFKSIKPVSAKVAAEISIIRDTAYVDVKMFGDNSAHFLNNDTVLICSRLFILANPDNCHDDPQDIILLARIFLTVVFVSELFRILCIRCKFSESASERLDKAIRCIL
jgi:hypothetical protein